MKLNEEQIERAKTVNLPSFLMANGFELKKVGREYVWKEHDSLHIKDNGPGERGQWFRFSENRGGDNIAFLREYMGMSFVDAVESLTGEHIDRSYTASHTYTPHHVQQTARELSLAEADNARRVFAYLCKTRGLDYDMVSALVRSGVISQEEKTGNVLFKYFDEHGKLIGAEKVGTSTEHKFKGVATGSAGGHGFEVCRGDSSNLLFFESSIDMLSYLQMFSPDNCRLVSMMGVKPNIVLDTMERYGIAPQNVYLCSDNDEAGNDFANRLIAEYPDMKRIATPDTYKDWNDMLRDIPQKIEIKKEADSVAIQTYGNKTWNDATDNRDKSLVTFSVQDFLKLQEKLEQAGINYFGYVRENSVIMAVGDKDMEWFKQIAGTPDLMPTKSNRPYSPPEKNIFGTAEYRYIPQKEYLTADRDLVLKMAEIMAKRGMQFSGRVYPSGKGTLTVSHADLFAVRNIRDEVVNMRKQFASPDKAQEVGNRDYRANRDTHYYMSKLTPEQFSEVKPFLETGVSYHAVSRDGKVAFALDKENAPAFHRALENAVREVGIIHTMQELDLSEDKMTALAPVMHRLAVENMQIDLADFFDQRYDDAQFGEMLSLVNAYINQPVAECYGEHSMLNDMLEAKSSFDRAIELSDFFSQHDFSDEQRAAITAMFVGDVTRGQLDSIDETFTAEDIQAYDEILHNALQESDVADFLTAHRQAVIERENTAKEPTEEEVTIELRTEESPIHFGLLGNGVTVYDISRTDPETHDYVTVAHISPEGVVKVYDDSISAEDMAKINDEARSVREKFMAEWDSLDTTTQYARLYNRADAETMLNIGREKISTEEKIAKYMPFVFFGEGERPQPEMAEKQRAPAVESIEFIGDRNGFEAVKNAAQNSSFGTIISDGDTLTIVVHNNASVDDVRHLVETAQDNGVYLNKPSAKLLESRFGADFMQETLKPTVADLSVGDVILYDGKRREVENISEKSIMLKDVDAPDFGGILLGTSDVLAYDGWQDDMNAKGFEIISKAEAVEERKDLGAVTIRIAGDYCEMRDENARIAEEVLGLTAVDGVVRFSASEKSEYAEKLSDAGYFVMNEEVFELNPPKRDVPEKNANALDRAINLINDFCAEEYSVEADFSDLSHVDIAYTTDADTELEIQVYADLEKFRMVTEYNGKTVREEQYDSLESMVDQALSNLDFNELAYLTDEERAVGEKSDIEQSEIGKNAENNTFIDEITKAVETAHADDEPSPERFEVRKNGDNFGIWDNIRDEFYTDDNGVVLTYANEKDAESGLAEVKKAVDEKESAEWLYAERSKLDEDVSEDMDAPLFTDAEIISEIQKNENSSDNRPFWEQPTLEGEQLSLFDDPVPIEPKKSHKQKSEFATGPVVDGVQVYNALAAEIDRGTGFVDGKLRVQEFYDEQHPTVQQLADFLKKAYGIGGHSGEGNISLVSTDSKGMTFDFRNGEKFRHSWYNVATMTEARLRDNTYLSAEQQEKYAKMRAEKAAESTLTPVESKSDESNIVTVGDKFRDRKTGEISEIISFSGALPWYEDQCTVQRESHDFIITENMSVDKLFDDKLYEYLGKGEVPEKSEVSEKTAEQVAPEKKAPVTVDAKQTAEMPKPKNLSQLKKALQVGMEFEILDHHKRERIGERRVVTGKNTANFTSKRLDENNQPYGDDIYMDWEKAGNWQFGSDKITVFMDTDKENILLSFRFIDGKEHEKSEPEKTAEVSVPETKEPVPVYTGEWKISDNKALFREIVAENERFAKMANDVIGNGKNPADSVKALVDEFGMERTAFLTALNIVSHPMDGRFYPADKEWACKVLAPYLDVKPDKNIHRDPEKERLFSYMIGGAPLHSIHNTHLAQFAETLIPEYEKYLELSHNAEKSEPELSVGDFIEYKGKEYKVESLDPDGFITLNAPMLDGKVQDRVTFITEEFLNNAEFKLIEPKTEDVPDKGDSFTITDDSLGSGGAKEKFRNNIAAIKMLKMLEKEHLPAYPEAKEVLSKYVGWGGLASAFDKNASSWAAEYAELKELLTPQEYRQAQASTLDAFYTSPTIINSIYEALDNFGFKSGNVLEPSMGIGNFFGCMSERMRVDSNLYGVELDSISGRIAQMLYPYADIAIKGFEHNTFQNGCFDVAVGNVPFGDLGFTDNKHFTSKLHDYFFMEALDKVKNGGIIAFVTSSGTLDKKDESVRQMLADKADLIGAIRLPGGKNGAFKGNAGTEVTTDIIFLQKHEGKTVAEMSDIPDWVHIGETADGLPINQYFVNHPDMVLGEVVKNTNPRGGDTMVIAEDGFDLKTALHDAVSKLHAEIDHDLPRDVYAKTAEGVQVQIPSNLRNYSFFMSDDQVFFKKNNAACEFRYDKSTSQHKRFKAFIELRDLTRELIEAMEFNKSDSVVTDLQSKLNTAYDDFYKKFGLIHSQTNKRYFSEDVSYNLVAGLEKDYDKNKLVEKSDIFTKRTIVPPQAVDHVDTALEALTLSVAEKAKVDFEYMSDLTGMTEDELKQELQGEIFKVPHTENEYQTASEYLSGDIRVKLKTAEEIAEYDADFNVNVNALRAAMPEPLKAGDIDVKIGATWLDPKYYEQFMYELLQTPDYQRSDGPTARWNKSSIIGVEYSEAANSFHVSNKSSDRSVLATQKFGSHKMNAYDIFEHILNLQEPKVYKSIEIHDGWGDAKEKRVVDEDATRVVQRKADDIRKAFKAWIFKDPQRREAIVQKYNELFNSIRPREYDGSALSFPLMNADIHLHDHQKNAIAHAMFGGNTLFAHCVGAGKTFEMIATAMESKRLGLCTKSLFAVPNHLTEQIGDDFQKLYPGANILVATKKDFKKENRQQLFAKIATGNYDAVIIGHSQLGKIPVSKERQVVTIQSQIDDILRGIEELKKQEGSKFQIKAMERTRKSLQKQLDKLEKTNQDDTLTFEQLGIDRLFIDEAHEFKNLFVSTKLQNVAGISNSASQKALDLFLKCRYLDEKTDGRGVIFATGTPLSNSVTELHTMMRYLEYDFLKDKGLQHFDSWVSLFGEQKTDWELAPAGNKFKERTRIAHYTGLPELMSMFKQVADIRTADTLKLDVPDCDYQVVQVDATPFQQELVQELADRADAINAGNVDPSIDNMLKITSDGRKLGLDPRLIDPSFEDSPDTKLNRCVENVARIHAETAEDRLTQIIFCDLGVPHKAAGETTIEGEDADDANDKKSMAELESLEEECDFCVYTDIRDKLIAKGVPAEEIAFIHDAKTEQQKSELFDKVRSGEIRVLLGSTAKMGTGTNVQKKLIAVHDLDIPWRPADLDQRAGRIIRQGNENKNVQIFRYVTKGTFDAYSYQTLENKQKFISQIMTSKTPARKCDDVDQQALTYSEIKALCTGDERIKEKLMLENDVKELRVLSAEHRNTVFEMEDRISAFPEQEKKLMTILDNLRTDRQALRKLPVDPERKLPVFKITIGDTEYTDRKEAAKALEDAVLAIKYSDTPVKVGSFQGFDLKITMNSAMMGGGTTATLEGAASHTTKLIESFAHNLNRLESALYNIDGRIERTQANLVKLRLDHDEAQKIVAEPFPQQAELDSKEERLKVLTDELNQAAIEAKKNALKREKTCYFERAKMKRDAMKLAKKPKTPKDKAKGKDKNKGIG